MKSKLISVLLIIPAIFLLGLSVYSYSQSKRVIPTPAITTEATHSGQLDDFTATASAATASATPEPIATKASAIATPKPTPTPAPTPTPWPQPSDEELNHWFGHYAGVYGVSPDLLKKIAQCESGMDVNRKNPHYDYAGLFQFSSTSWQTNRVALGENPDPYLRYSYQDAIKTAAFKISRDGTGAWPNCD